MYKLSSMRIVNFQTWKDSTVNFSAGLTVIEGENNSGKSALFKALKITADSESFTKEDRVQLIRHGQSSAKIIYTFSDNVSYIVNVMSKENGYYLGDEDGVEYVGTTLPADLRVRLGFLIGEGGIIGNLVDMDQNMFLVNSDDKLNYNILKLLTSDENLDNIISELETHKIPRVRSMLNGVRAYKKVAESKLNEFERIDVTKMKEVDKVVGENLEIMELLNSAFEPLREVEIKPSINSSLVEIVNDAMEIESILDGIDCDCNRDSVDVSLSDLIELEDIINSFDVTAHLDEVATNKDIELLASIEDLFKDCNGSIESVGFDKDLVDIEEILDSIKFSSCSGDLAIKEVERCKEELSKFDVIEGECPKYGKVIIANGECSPKL